MPKPAGMSELMKDLFHRAPQEGLLGGARTQPMQAHDGCASAHLGDAKDEVQISGITIRLGDADDGSRIAKHNALEQYVGLELSPGGVIGAARLQNFTFDPRLDASQAQFLRELPQHRSIDRLDGQERHSANRRPLRRGLGVCELFHELQRTSTRTSFSAKPQLPLAVGTGNAAITQP